MRRKRKKAPPPNYFSYREEGYGLWEIWYDLGMGSSAQPVMQGREPVRYLRDVDAAREARSLAERHPDRRYCVKLKR